MSGTLVVCQQSATSSTIGFLLALWAKHNISGPNLTRGPELDIFSVRVL